MQISLKEMGKPRPVTLHAFLGVHVCMRVSLCVYVCVHFVPVNIINISISSDSKLSYLQILFTWLQ